ncbi:hypothetical protein ACL02O_07440 [Micromonospora sp. MS34]|uniref:hypothetical protein n=1 Tax=Micromonospora sp. MS34 TaxID=3385971 RepID=UPI0039A02D8B
MSQVEPPVARGVATPTRHVGRAQPTPAETAMFQLPDVTAAIFVDRSGRRARHLRRVAYTLVAVVLALLSAFWLLQGLDVLGALS